MRNLWGNELPLWPKLAVTGFVIVLVPAYWREYGPANFLFYCDVALLLTVVALWTESRFLTSMQLVAIGLPQLAWIIEFFMEMFGLPTPIGLAGYMFNADIPLFLRGLSLFHGWLPVLLVWMVWRLGYDRRAWVAQVALSAAVLVASYLFTPPPPAPPESPNAAVNVNWVFGLSNDAPQQFMPPLVWLGMLIVVIPVVFYLPAHLLLRRIAPSEPSGEPRSAPST